MNPRIKELLKQATKEVDPHDRVWVFSKVDQAKFAELLLNDCCEVLLKWKSEPFPFDEDVAVSLIKEQYGIEK